MVTNIPKFGLPVLLLCSFTVTLTLHVFVANAADDKVNASTPVNNGEGENGGIDVPGRGGSAAGNVVDLSKLCNVDVNSFLPPPYDNVPHMFCKPLWNNFLLRYHKGEDNLMTFVVSAVYTTGWVGIGFSKDGKMIGSSAMVGWFSKKGIPRIKQFYLQGAKQSEVIVDSGEIPLTKIPPAVVLHQAMIHLAFQAKFDKPFMKQPILLAFGTKYPNHHHLSKHDDKTAILFDFSSGSSSAHLDPENMKRNHGALGILSWGLVLPVGAVIARYLRHKDPLWYYLHAIFQFLGFLLGLATVVLGTQLYATLSANIPVHRGIGIFVLVLSILQILAFFLRPKKEAKIRQYWNWYHHWFGRIALFFGALNIVLGIKYASAGNSMKIGFGFPITLILIAVIILEILSRMRKPSKNTVPPSFQMNPIQTY